MNKAIIQSSKDDGEIANCTYGALFFGVPNQGMDIGSLKPMVGHRPNDALLMALGRGSHLLRMQIISFQEAFNFPDDSKIFCFYETRMSRTARNVSRICKINSLALLQSSSYAYSVIE